jgi:transcriptional regulator with XRE-family HTH domain
MPGDDEFYRSAGAKIRAARTAVGLSQTLLAERVGLTRSSITNIEAARQRVPLYHFVQICYALNCRFEDLLPERTQSVDYPSSIIEDRLSSPVETMRDLKETLANSPDTARDFVYGAVARLTLSREKEEER